MVKKVSKPIRVAGKKKAAPPPAPENKVIAAAVKVKDAAAELRLAIGDLATTRSETPAEMTEELKSKELEAIQEANLAVGAIPRPGV